MSGDGPVLGEGRSEGAMRVYIVEYELDRMVEGQRDYAGPHTGVIHAETRSSAEDIFEAYIRRNNLLPSNDLLIYSIENVPRKRGFTKLSGNEGPERG